MGKRPKRQIVLFLVEGKSDREALQLAIPELYDQIDENIEVFFPTMVEDKEEKGGDITSKIKIWPRNIEEKIYEFFLKDFFDEQKIMPKDITEIVQIVDMDGAYVSDDMVCAGENPTGENRPYYTENAIITQRVENIIKRNAHKRENIDYLSSLQTIKVRQKTVKYSVYYFSANLDHFLHYDANLDYRKKIDLADTFARTYIGNVEGFIKQITDDPGAAVGMDYEQSWNFIKTEGCNSLQRHTNLNILLSNLQKESKVS